MNAFTVCAIPTNAIDIPVDWESIFKRSNKKLINFIRMRVASMEDVEDIAQMTCLEVLRNRHKFTGASLPETWMFGIAINLIRNHYKRQQQRYLFETLNDEVLENLLDNDDPSALTEHQQLLTSALSSIDRLPEEIKYMLTILIYDDGSYQDIAQQLNIPIGTVRSRLSRTRETLKNKIFL
ncbi:sigma-70 family RNA polymerase sigma factor [Pantoea stewartii]|uniref:RNA polymerase sigma factor n=1 Tax=Pantoea stewartii TaxID=66269 RepID=UPI0021D502F8|nr:sigma-70 family RNA polymerase sigma factor [Pantoea stewartii]MCU7369206.1 sigma-70 family RNA polymerase sigma factor [Pantoea stewartii]